MGMPVFILVVGAIGLFAGVVGGLLGVGGGIVMVPAFIRFVGLETHRAVGTSMVVIVFTAIVASTKHWQAGNVDPKVAITAAALAVFGGYIGASFASSLPARTLQMIFSGFLLIVAIDMGVRAFNME